MAEYETTSNDVGISELENTTEIEDSSLFIVEDAQNTKTITLTALRRNLISDTDVPSDTKVYSSQKMNQLITTHEERMNGDVVALSVGLENVKANYAKKTDVNSQITNIESVMFTQTDRDNLETMIGSKRDIDILITSSDLDKSSDVAKIHIANLGEDILAAMTGETPVSLVKAPQGGWTTESYANESITSDKLSGSYRFKRTITRGSINDISDDGIYILGPQVTEVPKFNEEDEDPKVLYVSIYGTNKEFIEQRVEYIYQTGARPYYIRKGKRLSLPALEFVQHNTITDKFKVDVSLFGDTIADRGTITEGSIFEYLAEGNYKVSAGVDKMPTLEDDYFVTVSKCDDYYIYEAKLNSYNSCIVYVCYVHLNEYGTTVATDWFKISDINKSKFDDQRIHIFGDGIAYGYTDPNLTDANSLIYPSLLFSKYGFKVFNHAQEDATMGNYGVMTIKERSVLTQIENTTFEDKDFVIIFAGTNDYKIGSCPVGADTDLKDTTFKGSLNMAIKAIFEKNPSVKLLLITPMYRSRIDSGDDRSSDDTKINGRLLKEYTTAVTTIAEMNHVPVMDMMTEGLINKYNSSYWLYDGLYFSKDGHGMFATRLYDKLNTLY